MSETSSNSFEPRASDSERLSRKDMLEAFRKTPIPDNEILDNLALFTRRQNLSSLLCLAEIYRLILNVHGIVCEFGNRWGRNLVTFTNLRGTYEPFNFYRKIVGFDTFTGFPAITTHDGLSEEIRVGAFAVTPFYEDYLEQLLALHEMESPLSHIRRFELRKGDAAVELNSYLVEHPETVVALAYFDLDLYEPTRACLELLQPYLTKGSVIAFDELVHCQFPGETMAFREVFGTRQFHLHRNPISPSPAYIIVD